MSLLLHEMLVDGVSGAPHSSTFASTWRTAAAGETITLPLDAAGTYNFVVDWGDGAIETITSATDPKRIHTYASAGDHQVRITGTIIGWAFANGGDKLKIRSVDSWGPLQFTFSQAGHFRGCSNLTITATDTPYVPTSCAYMFDGCTSLVNVPSMALWDVSKAKNMSFMFNGANKFNTDIGSWDTSSADTMQAMFNGASAFNQDISKWNVAKVASMNGMFQNASVFNQPIGSWNTANLSDGTNLFFNAVAFDQNINSWNTAKLVLAQGMFAGASIFNQPLSSWTMSACINMYNMFSGALKFNQPIGSWDVSKVRIFGYTFYRAQAFNQDISGWNTISALEMNYMFKDNPVFNQNIGGWNTEKVTTMEGMFQGAHAFNQNISGWNTGLVAKMGTMFSAAFAFNCGQPAGTVHSLMQRTSGGGWRIGGITSANLNAMFQDAHSFAGDISNWCADVSATLPTNFATNAHANFTPALQPTWGACPIPD